MQGAIDPRIHTVAYDWRRDKDQVLLEYLNDNVAHISKRLQALGTLEAAPASLPEFL